MKGSIILPRVAPEVSAKIPARAETWASCYEENMGKYTSPKEALLARLKRDRENLKLGLATADAEGIAELGRRIKEYDVAIEQQQRARGDLFRCARHGDFEGNKRVLYEVTARLEFDEESNTVSAEKFRDSPRYLVLCPACDEELGFARYVRSDEETVDPSRAIASARAAITRAANKSATT
jgi:hypothetical protein